MKALEHIDKLGLPVRDRVTGFEGVVTSVSFDLYGCIQVVVTPRQHDPGKLEDSRWFDISRLEFTGERVMEMPNFDAGPVANGERGPAEKPTRETQAGKS